LNLPRHYNVNDDRINEVLAHLAWELVGLVTQTSLIVKRDMQMVAVMNSIKQQQSGMDYFTLASFYNTTGLMNTELEKLMGKVSGVMDDKIRRQLSANPDVYFMHIGEPIASSGLQLKPLTSVHVLEAIRRVSQLYKY
jgi:ribulose 1,5-bisphosphate carboxylase large subunit-like protein